VDKTYQIIYNTYKVKNYSGLILKHFELYAIKIN